MGPGKTTYSFSVTFRFPLRPFSVLPAGGGGWVRQGGGGSGSGNGKYIGISGKHIRKFTLPLKLQRKKFCNIGLDGSLSERLFYHVVFDKVVNVDKK